MNVCLPWSEVEIWARLLDVPLVPLVPVIYSGPYDRKLVEQAFTPHEKENEGYVVRIAGGFPYGQFRNSVGKYVRKDHVATHGHWMRQRVEPNGLRPK